MDVERRLAALEARLRAAEDQLEILRLLNSYGPLVDSGSANQAAELWQVGGGYDFTVAAGGTTRLEAPEGLVELYLSELHTDLVAAGVAHITATPSITVDGDCADAVGYSFVIRRDGDRWCVWRAAVNRWTLTRASAGWRITERTNRTLDGSPESHAVMRTIIGQPDEHPIS